LIFYFSDSGPVYAIRVEIISVSDPHSVLTIYRCTPAEEVKIKVVHGLNLQETQEVVHMFETRFCCQFDGLQSKDVSHLFGSNYHDKVFYRV
jgi:hypothetical protein